MTKRPTDGIRRECGIVEGMRDNEFATVEVRKAAIAEACGRVDAEVDAMRGRLMPEGMEWLIEAWPKFEDDASVKLGDMALIDGDVDMVEAVQIWIHGKPVIYGDSGSQQLEKGERVKRPAVLAADGEPLEVGQTVWDANGDELVVGALEDGGHTVICRYADVGDGIPTHGMWSPSELTHQRPVLDADGVPIHKGDEVRAIWNLTGHSYVVEDASNPLEIAVRAKEYPDQRTTLRAKNLTHTKPEIDSWERIEEDAWDDDCEYFGRDMNDCKGCPASRQDIDDFYCDENEKARDLVRRARALAEKENRNE